jgi:signal transduction histidine kinase
LVKKESERLRVSLTTSLDDKVPEILMDGEQIKQALLNLVINAMHATPPGGRIELSTSQTSGSVRLTVKDSGLGIPESIRERLFTPFVTTKEGGTGLGLAIAMRLVKQHNGMIEVKDVPEGGTIFEIELPNRACRRIEPAQTSTGSAMAVEGLRR